MSFKLCNSFKQILMEMATEEEKAIAQKTARSTGAVGEKAIVPKVVRQIADKEKDVILNCFPNFEHWSLQIRRIELRRK